MYKDFYGLNEFPFSNVPDTDFIFKSSQYVRAYNHIMYGVQSRAGFMMVVGDVGTGKTTLCRSLLQSFDETIESALIFNPPATAMELMRALLHDLGLGIEGDSKEELLERLNTHLLACAAAQKTVVLLIDEAQDLSADVLEEVRLLSNLETRKQKLLQIILIGQPELEQKLGSYCLRQLLQRIAIDYRFDPLTAQEVAEYIRFRLVRAGAGGDLCFTRSAARAAFVFSGGVPRVVNLLCEKALLAGYAAQKKVITRAMVREAARNTSCLRRTGMPLLRPAAAAAILCAVLVVAAVLFLKDSGQFLLEKPFVGDSAASPSALVTSENVIPGDCRQPDVAVPAAADGAFDAAGVMRNSKSIDGAPEALATLLALWGCDKQLLIDDVRRRRMAGRSDLFGRVADFGLQSKAMQPTFEQLRLLNYPCLVALADPVNRYVVVRAVNGELLRLLDPQQGVREMSRSEFSRLWSGKALYVWQEIDDLPVRMYRGDRHDALVLIKQNLGACCFQVALPCSKNYDDEFWKIVKQLQRKYGLTVDGVFGTRTKLAYYRSVYAAVLPSLATPFQIAGNSHEYH